MGDVDFEGVRFRHPKRQRLDRPVSLCARSAGGPDNRHAPERSRLAPAQSNDSEDRGLSRHVRKCA
jgi:hypothetical protein